MYSTPPRYTSPPSYSPYDYRTTSISPSSGQYSSRTSYGHSSGKAAASKSHSRHASYAPSSYHYSDAYYASPPAYGAYYTTQHAPHSKHSDFVSGTERMRHKARGSADLDGSKQRSGSSKKSSSGHKPPKYVYTAVVDEDEGYYSQQRTSPPPSYPDSFRTYRVADHHDQSSSRKHSSSESTSKQRTRASSFSSKSKPSSSSKQSARPRTSSSAAKSPRTASAADLSKHKIPAGYSYKNWDPDESPILLLGSVFDANSLGKWIYDWTVYRHGPATPLADEAGDLWLLLIQLAGKVKRAEECLKRIKYQDDFDLVEDFLESGDRLWTRLCKILKTCEDHMWRAAKKEAKKKGGNAASIVMGPKSGCEFVDSIFGRDRLLEDTEKLMHGMRLWNMRFEANCEKILRHPSG